MTTTRKRGRFFPTTDHQEIETALQAFAASQERYETAERWYMSALERNERPSRAKLEQLEREYKSAAIFAANVMLGRMMS